MQSKCPTASGGALRLNKAIWLNPNYAEDWNNKGIALKAQSKYDEAIKAYDEAIRLNPNDAKAYYAKGVVLKTLGRMSEANAAFAKAKELGIRANPGYRLRS